MSVVITTYGRPQFLTEAIASVATQTYRNVELIIVDDCSPEPVTVDGAIGVDVKLLRHRRNMGVSSARNTGLAHASGDLLTFLDDDDTFAADRIERGVREIGDAHMHAVRTTADDRVFDGDMRTTLFHAKDPYVHQVMYRTEDAAAVRFHDAHSPRTTSGGSVCRTGRSSRGRMKSVCIFESMTSRDPTVRSRCSIAAARASSTVTGTPWTGSPDLGS